jgi:hypothetical protein
MVAETLNGANDNGDTRALDGLLVAYHRNYYE